MNGAVATHDDSTKKLVLKELQKIDEKEEDNDTKSCRDLGRQVVPRTAYSVFIRAATSDAGDNSNGSGAKRWRAAR